MMKNEKHPILPACRLTSDALAQSVLTALQQGTVATALEPALVFAERYGQSMPDAEALCAMTLSRAGHHDAALEHWDKALRRKGLNAARLAQALRAAWAVLSASPRAKTCAERWQKLLEHLFTDVPDPGFLQELTSRGWQGIGCVGIHQEHLRGWLWLPSDRTFHVQISGGPSFSLGEVRRAVQGDHTLHVLDAPLPETTTPFSLHVVDTAGRHAQGSPLQISPACSILAHGKQASRHKPEAAGLTVIVPVYDDRQATLSCLASVFLSRKKNRTPFRLLVLWDHGPDRQLAADLRRLAAQGKFLLKEPPHNLGFLAGVNFALSLVPQGDVILLNADTLVHGDWIDRMAQALRREDTGTVTALGTDAELVSFPSPDLRGDVRRLRDVRRLDEACRLIPADTALKEIPVGVGFCMGIARRALRAVGGFDGRRLFGGYGEEVDFCLRVAEAGLKNLAAMNIFVAHLGGRSFGMAKRALVAQNNAAIFARYPRYDAEYSAFLSADPLAPLRDCISRAACGPLPEGTPLHVFAWTEQFMPPLSAKRLPATYAALFVLPLPGGGARMRLRLRQALPLEDMTFLLPEEQESLCEVLRRCRLDTATAEGASSLVHEALAALPLRLSLASSSAPALPQWAGQEESVLALPPHSPAAWRCLCRLAQQFPATRFFVFTLFGQMHGVPCPANMRPLPYIKNIGPLGIRALLMSADSPADFRNAWQAWLSDHGCTDVQLYTLPDEDVTSGEHRMKQAAVSGEATLSGLGVFGWARSEGMSPLWLELLADDVVVGTGRADMPEPDGCGFYIPVPAFVAESPCTLRVRVANTGCTIGDALRIPGKDGTGAALQGELAADAGQTISGWATDTTHPGKRLQIQARCEGRIVARALASERRFAPLQGDGHGFVLHLPPELADGREHIVDVEDDRGRPLPGSPLTFCTLATGLSGWLNQQKKLDAAGRDLLLNVLQHMESRLPQAQGLSRLAFWKKAFPVPAASLTASLTVSIVMDGGSENDIAALWRQQKAPSCRRVADKADMTLLLRKGERLHPAALAHLADTLKKNGAGLVYADGESTDADGHPTALCKPSWDRDAFMGRDYLGPILVSRAVMEAAAREEGEALEAWRVRLALAAETLGGIRHLPYLLSEELAPDTGDARRTALQHWLDAHHPGAVIEAQERPWLSRVRYPLRQTPRVSIIIPTRDHADLLRRCLEGLQTTDYANIEILVVDNDTTEQDALALLEEISALPQARVLRCPGIFNYAAINNTAVREASGDLLCLCNNDTEMPHADWLQEMVSLLLAAGDQAGCVGAKLLWPNGLVQHGGVVVGTHQLACHAGNHWLADEPGYMDRNLIVQQYSAVTAACLLTPRALYEELGGLDAWRFPVTFNDVDYCLRVRAAGKKILWTPFARVMHHESSSRGKDTAPMNKARADREMRAFRNRWPFYEDCFYNPNLPLCTAIEPFEGLALPPRTRHAR